MWLTYIQFEKLQGDPLRAGGLFTRAEKELEAKQAQIFKELHMAIRELLGKVIFMFRLLRITFFKEVRAEKSFS